MYVIDIQNTKPFIDIVMEKENCSRRKALRMIDYYRRIASISMELTGSERSKIYRKIRKVERKCMCCGKQDAETLKGKSRCASCAKRQSEYIRGGNNNATVGQNH